MAYYCIQYCATQIDTVYSSSSVGELRQSQTYVVRSMLQVHLSYHVPCWLRADLYVPRSWQPLHQVPSLIPTPLTLPPADEGSRRWAASGPRPPPSACVDLSTHKGPSCPPPGSSWSVSCASPSMLGVKAAPQVVAAAGLAVVRGSPEYPTGVSSSPCP